MSNKIPQEEWTPLPFMEGEHALSKMSYNKFLNKINGDLNIYAQNSA